MSDIVRGDERRETSDPPDPEPLTAEMADSYCQTAVVIIKTIRRASIRENQKLALLSRIADAADFHLHRIKLESGFK